MLLWAWGGTTLFPAGDQFVQGSSEFFSCRGNHFKWARLPATTNILAGIRSASKSSHTNAAVSLPQVRRARHAHLLSSCAGLQQRQLYTAFQVPQASLDSEQGPHRAKRCLVAVVFVHVNAQPGNVNHIPPSRYLCSKFVILQHGKLPVKVYFHTIFSSSQFPTDYTVKFKEISSINGNTSPGLHTLWFVAHSPTAAFKETNRDQLTDFMFAIVRFCYISPSWENLSYWQIK